MLFDRVEQKEKKKKKQTKLVNSHIPNVSYHIRYSDEGNYRYLDRWNVQFTDHWKLYKPIPIFPRSFSLLFHAVRLQIYKSNSRVSPTALSLPNRCNTNQTKFLATILYLLEYFVGSVVIGLLLDGISEHCQRSQRYALFDTGQLRIDPHLVHRAVAQTAKQIVFFFLIQFLIIIIYIWSRFIVTSLRKLTNPATFGTTWWDLAVIWFDGSPPPLWNDEYGTKSMEFVGEACKLPNNQYRSVILS